jgi:CDP-diacylglycerol--glycerol-3-phosphate 3-phosphatidyltransferase
MLSHYKAPLSRLGDPVARILLQAHVRPNHLTVVGLGVSIVAAVALAEGRLRMGAVLLTLAGLFDFFDGSLARLANRVSAFGAFLDSVVDRYSDLVVMLGIVLFYHQAADTVGVFLTMFTVLGTVMVSYTKARAQSIGLPCEIGLMERPERLIVLIAGATFNLLTAAMVVLAVLTNLTALQRIFYTRAASTPPRVPVPAPAVTPAPVVSPIAAPARAAEPDTPRLRPSA